MKNEKLVRENRRIFKLKGKYLYISDLIQVPHQGKLLDKYITIGNIGNSYNIVKPWKVNRKKYGTMH